MRNKSDRYKGLVKITESDLKFIISESIKKLSIKEGISSIVYHYTHPSSLLSIIKSNELKVSDDIEMPNGVLSRGGLSVTRQRSDKIGYGVAFRHEFFDGCYVRLQLDGDLLSCNYRGEVVDEFGDRGDMHIDDFNEYNRMAFRTQAEDRVYTKNGEPIKNAFKYITRIDIMFPIYDNRYDYYLEEIDVFLKNLVNIALNTGWENKIYLYFDDEIKSGRKDFNFQTSNYYTLRDVERDLMNEGMEKDYDILYRGINNKQVDVGGIWLSTSDIYAGLYGEVKMYKIPVIVLDKLANEEEALKYLIVDTDEYPFYFPEYFDLDRMKKDGYTGYYYHEQEYGCLNVYLCELPTN